MTAYVTKIKTKIPYTNKHIEIDAQGKTIILTGGNGCGKTALLKLLQTKLNEKLIDKKNKTVAELENIVNALRSDISTKSPTDANYDRRTSTLNDNLALLEDAKNPILELNNTAEFIEKYKDKSSVLLMFDAMRESKIIKPISVSSIEALRDKDKIASKGKHNTSSLFEEFLVSNIAKQAFSESKKISFDPTEADRISMWFFKLENDLKELFEDNSLEVKFYSESFSFKIHQKDKEPFTFQTLSSGYSSIMSVYAELFTKISLSSINPEDLSGIIIIDEIDAHLHVSLQKKILKFLTKSFPQIQFIVSTHSPFVVSSIEDVVIYDLSKQQQVENLSLYSYDSVLEALFGVLPISKHLQSIVESISSLLKQKPIDINALECVLKTLPNDIEGMDPESEYFIKTAKLALHKNKVRPS